MSTDENLPVMFENSYKNHGERNNRHVNRDYKGAGNRLTVVLSQLQIDNTDGTVNIHAITLHDDDRCLHETVSPYPL